MRRFLIVCFLLILSGTLLPSYAQEAVQEPLEIGDSGTEYLRAIRLRGIDTDVAYFDPSAPPPKLDTTQEPPKPAADQADPTIDNRWIPGLIVGGILIAVAYFFLRFGGRFTVSLGREAGNPDSTRPRIRGQAPIWALTNASRPRESPRADAGGRRGVWEAGEPSGGGRGES